MREKYSGFLLCRLKLQFPFPGALSAVAILVAGIRVIIHVPPDTLLGASAIVVAVTVTVAAGVAVAEAVILSAAVAAGSVAVVDILVAPAAAPFAEVAVFVAAVAGAVVAGAGPPRR